MSMMRRRTALSASLGLLASCSTPKKVIPGTQIPVLPDQTGMDVAPDAPAVHPAAPPPRSAPGRSLSPIPPMPPAMWRRPLGFKPRWQRRCRQRRRLPPAAGRQPARSANGQVFTMDADAHVRAFSLL